MQPKLIASTPPPIPEWTTLFLGRGWIAIVISSAVAVVWEELAASKKAERLGSFEKFLCSQGCEFSESPVIFFFYTFSRFARDANVLLNW